MRTNAHLCVATTSWFDLCFVVANDIVPQFFAYKFVYRTRKACKHGESTIERHCTCDDFQQNGVEHRVTHSSPAAA